MKIETRLPWLVYNSSTLVDIVEYPGNPYGYTNVLFSDGKYRYFTGSLQVDDTVEGKGGLASLPITSSSWYHFFLVPSDSDDDQCDIIADDDTTASAGPLSGDAFRYIGSLRNNASDNWVVFRQSGPDYHFLDLRETVEIGRQSTLTRLTWHSWDYDDGGSLPSGVVSKLYLGAGGNTSGQSGSSPAADHEGFIVQGGTVGGTDWTLTNPLRGRRMMSWGDDQVQTGAGWHGFGECPLMDGDTHVWYGVTEEPENWSLGLFGFTNKYLED